MKIQAKSSQFSDRLSISSLLVILAGFFATSDGVWSDAASGFFKGLLGDSYILMQEQSLLLIAMVIILSKLGVRARSEFLLVCLAFVSIGSYEYLTSIFLDTGAYGARQLAFGFVFPVLLILFALRTKSQTLFFRSYYIGYIVYICSSLIILFFFDGNFKLISSQGLGSIVLGLRNLYDNSLFFLVVGNANKQSNYLIMSILLGPPLLELKGPNKLYSIFVFCAVILLFLLCSRAGLLLLPVALYLNRQYFIPLTRKAKIFILVSLGLFFIIYIQELWTILNYAAFNMRIDQGSDQSDFLGTFHSRFIQWDHVLELVNDPMILLYGIGVGNYGLREGGSAALGTHNLFLDHLVSSGLYGVLVLVLIIGYGATKSFLLRDRRLIVTYLCFVALAFREYSFAYVYVTSMGGLMFVFLLYATFSGSGRVTAQTSKNKQ